MDNTIGQKIKYEMSQIDKELDASEPLLTLCKTKKPDRIERAAAALLLHSYYNGLEKVMILIFKNIDTALPSGNRWHTELFEKAFAQTSSHRNIFRDSLKDELHNYMSFRHFIRHTYDFQLDWEMMKDLVNNLQENWRKVKEDLNNFMEDG